MTDQIKQAIEWQDTELTYEEVEQAQSIDKLLEQRGSTYGSFEAQATCVGKIISALDDVAVKADRTPDHYEIGCWAYIAIKMARTASNPKHLDNTHDLEGYSRLINKLYKEMNNDE